MRKFLIFFSLALFVSCCLIFAFNQQYVFTVFRYNLPDLNDYRIFANRIVPPSKAPQPWPKKKAFNKFPLPDSTNLELERLNSTACIIIHRDSLLFEKYWTDTTSESLSNSFSMAKSYVSALIGVALKEGRINSLDDEVGDYLKDFKVGRKSAITIKNLLCMSSGLDWNESYYNPFSTVSEAYYGKDLHQLIKGLNPTENPGEKFQYKGSDTQVLAFILEKTYGQTLSKILYEKLWNPLGAEQQALWSLDHASGNEKASCCLNSNARDFARIGSLYLHYGRWKGVQIIDSIFIEQSLRPLDLQDVNGEKVDFYGYQWWLIPSYKGGAIFYARGILGQYIIVDPTFETVIVRLGHKRGEKLGHHYKEAYSMIEAAREMITK